MPAGKGKGLNIGGAVGGALSLLGASKGFKIKKFGGLPLGIKVSVSLPPIGPKSLGGLMGGTSGGPIAAGLAMMQGGPIAASSMPSMKSLALTALTNNFPGPSVPGGATFNLMSLGKPRMPGMFGAMAAGAAAPTITVSASLPSSLKVSITTEGIGKMLSKNLTTSIPGGPTINLQDQIGGANLDVQKVMAGVAKRGMFNDMSPQDQKLFAQKQAEAEAAAQNSSA